MPGDQFHLVIEVCRSGLDATEEQQFRRRVVRLRNALARAGRDAPLGAERSRAEQRARLLSELLAGHPCAGRPPGAVSGQGGHDDHNGRARANGHDGHADGHAAQARPAPVLKGDPLVLMARKGTLEEEHMLAAREIRTLAGVLVNGLAARSVPWDEMRNDLRTAGPYRHPIERMPERLVRCYHDHYRPWAKAMEARRFGARTYTDLTLDVVVDGVSLHAIERGQRMRNGSASKCLRASLRHYAELAGWLDPADGDDAG